MRDMATIKLGTRGKASEKLQATVNQRLTSRRPSARIIVDGDWGPKSKEACRIAGHLMGVLSAGKRPGRCQQVVLDEACRTKWERKRATRRMTAERAKNQGPAAALAFGRKYIGKTENPAGSNTAPWGLGTWILQLLGVRYGVYWCGVFVWAMLRAAGVKGLTSRCASVSLTYDDAKAGRNGWAKLVDDRQGQPGDAVGLFSISTHIGVIEKRVAGGYQTLEGNTSSGPGGSQNNGGGVYRRTRSYSDVAYVARPRY